MHILCRQLSTIIPHQSTDHKKKLKKKNKEERKYRKCFSSQFYDLLFIMWMLYGGADVVYKVYGLLSTELLFRMTFLLGCGKSETDKIFYFHNKGMFWGIK